MLSPSRWAQPVRAIIKARSSNHSQGGPRPQARRTRPQITPLEDRCLLSGDIRSIDGTGNNLANPTWGSAGVDLLRVGPAAYIDGISSPAGANRPSARVVSNTIADQGDADIISDRFLSAMIYAWGQFIDHDLDLTPAGTPAQSFDVPVPAGDPYFDPNGTGNAVIPLTRSLYDPATGTRYEQPATTGQRRDGLARRLPDLRVGPDHGGEAPHVRRRSTQDQPRARRRDRHGR
jgi:hypothetical protein